MPQNKRTGRPRRERHIRIREDRKREPDLKKIAGAVIALALAQAEKDAEEGHTTPLPADGQHGGPRA